MPFAAFFLGAAVFLISMEMWSRAHPSHLVPGDRDPQEFSDRFLVADSGVQVATVTDYLDFIAESGSRGGLVHNYIDHGLRLLTLSLQGVSGLSLRVETVDRMQAALRYYVDGLEAHPGRALEPARVRTAFFMAIEIMDALNLPYDADAGARIRKADRAAKALEPERSTLWQRSKLQDFFICSGQAVVALKRRSGASAGGKPPPPP